MPGVLVGTVLGDCSVVPEEDASMARRRAAAAAGAGLTLVGLLAGHALATGGSARPADLRATGQLWQLASSERVALTLAPIEQRVAAGTEQWGRYPLTAVLTQRQRQAALADVWAAGADIQALLGLEARPLAPASRADVDALQARLDALVARLVDLLDNAPDVTAVVQQKLDRIAARSAQVSDRWQAVGSGTVLGPTRRDAAEHDLRTTRHHLRLLAALTRGGVLSTEQERTARALTSRLGDLAGHLVELLDNRAPAVRAPATAEPVQDAPDRPHRKKGRR